MGEDVDGDEARARRIAQLVNIERCASTLVAAFGDSRLTGEAQHALGALVHALWTIPKRRPCGHCRRLGAVRARQDCTACAAHLMTMEAGDD